MYACDMMGLKGKHIAQLKVYRVVVEVKCRSKHNNQKKKGAFGDLSVGNESHASLKQIFLFFCSLFSFDDPDWRRNKKKRVVSRI